MMARSHFRIILTVLLSVGVLSASLTPPAEEAAADDDEIALEDYVDNELPNFSGDLSSSVFGDAGGYDVHIEVKIANRSKSKDDNLHRVSELLSPTSLGSSQNHDKAKKILDLIIEKLKRKKDAKGTLDDDTDIEISEKDDFVGETKAKHKTPDNISSGNSNLFNDDVYGPLTPAGDFADSSKSKSDTNDKHTAFSSSSMPKSEKHAFSLPETIKTENKGEEFSFKSVNSAHKQAPASPELPELTNHKPPKLNDSPEKSSEVGENSKSNEKEWESTKSNKDVKIKISDDGEIRIKIPEILNKSSLVSKIVNIVNEDDKNRESDITNGARQALVNMESKLSETQNGYKLLLLKKLHANGKIPTDQDQVSDVPTAAVSDTPAKETVSIPNDNMDSKADQPMYKTSSENDKQKESVKKKEKAGDNLEDLPVKKISKVSKTNNEDDLITTTTGVQSEEKAVKDDDAEKVATEKVKQRENKAAVASDQEFRDMPKNDAFVPNRVASKSFQENLEPEDIEYKTFEGYNSNPTEKKALNIVPLDLHIDDVDPPEKISTMLPKKAENRTPLDLHIDDIDPPEKISSMLPKKVENRAPPSRQRKLETFTNNAPSSDTQKYVQMQIVQMPNENNHDIGGEDREPSFNPGRLFNDSLFQQAGLDNSDGIESKHKMEKQQSPAMSFNGNTNHDFKLSSGRKGEMSYSNHPVIDLLTFPTSSEISATMLENKRKTSHPAGEEVKQYKLHNTNTHVTDHRHDTSYGRKKTPNMADGNHSSKTHTFNNKDVGKGAPVLKEKTKPSSSLLPSTLFSDETTVAKSSSKKNKNNKKTDNFALELKDIKDSAASKANTRKLDLSDLESLQVQSKDNLEIGGNAQDDEGARGEDDEYEDASGDEEDEEEGEQLPNNTEQASLNNANLAIWKASEDIHALLHSLTDREHADRVLGNLKNFIKDKHSGPAKKRNSLGHKSNEKKEKRNFPNLNKKSGHKAKNKFPENLEVRKRSAIGQKIRVRKQASSSKKQIQTKNSQIEKRQNINHFDKYTKLTGNGIDRLYNQLAMSSSRISPTFDDDPEGWSSEEVKNVMKQLKTSDLETDMPGNGNGVTAGYDDGDYSDYRRHVGHVGVPQTNMPVSEENVAVTNAMPSIEQFKKNDNTQQKSVFPGKYKDEEGEDYNGIRDGNRGVQVNGDSLYPFNSTVHFTNGDYIGVDSPSDNYDMSSRRHNDVTNRMQRGL